MLRAGARKILLQQYRHQAEVAKSRAKFQSWRGTILMQSFKPKARNEHGDSDPTYGNGWAILKTRNQITGAEFIHRGDESTFTAQTGELFQLHS